MDKIGEDPDRALAALARHRAPDDEVKSRLAEAMSMVASVRQPPAAGDVLMAFGRHLPDKRAAKEARKSAFKLGSASG